MKSDGRRRFLRTAGFTGGAAFFGAFATLDAGTSHAALNRAEKPDLPKRKRLATIWRDGEWRLACDTAQGVLDVAAAGAAIHVTVPRTLDELFAGGGGSAVDQVVANALSDNSMRKHFVPVAQVRFGPCVLSPQKIAMVGLNYRKHIAEVGAQVPQTPLLFNKFNNALLGHGNVLRLPTAVSYQFDHEVELVIVIGRRAAAVDERNALSHVAGYCTGNDFSARDLQRVTSQFMLGKTCDDFAPLGPWMVTADLVPDPGSLDLWCDINGKRRQSSNTSDMIFNCAQIVSYLSRHMTLEPGDIIYTGTPEGVIAGMPEDKRVWLKAGDVVTCGIHGLGELTVTLA